MDVRSFPRSRSNPVYNIDTQPECLANHQVAYHLAPALLLLNGREVVHLMGNGREDPAKATPGAERTADGKVVYAAASRTA